MKTIKKVFLAAVMLAVAVVMLTGCGFIARNADGDIVISGGTLYEVNDRQELDMGGVESIRIGSVSDEVTILAGGEVAVAELKGQCRSVGEPVRLETRNDGGTLVIEVKYPNNSIRSNNTKLTVTIPAEYAGSLDVGTVSGGIKAEGLPFRFTRVHLGTVSGGIRFDTASFESLEAGTISGGIRIGGIAAPVKANSVSGEVRLAYVTPAETDVTTVSGGVSATIPGDAAFRVDFGSVSGNFRSSHSAINVTSAGKSFSATVADGTALIEVNTTSGGFTIEE